MISEDLEKIRIRGLSKDKYVDELPLNWYKFYADAKRRRIQKKSFRTINREHKIDSYPED